MALTKINASVIANNTIAVGNIADNSVDATKIASNSILTRHIDDNQVTTDQIAANTIATANIADNAVDGTKIASNSILTRHIDDDQITTDQILNDAVTADKLANSINTDIATGPAALPKAGGTMTGALIGTTARFNGTTTAGLVISSSSTASSGFKIYNNSSTDTANLNNHFSGPMVFSTANTERMRIGSSGKTSWSAGGIGTVATQARDFTFYTEGSANGVAIHSNDQRLIFMGAAASSGTGVDTGYLQIENGGSAAIALNSNGDSYFNGGKVGIGTASPARKLHVKSADTNMASFEGSNGEGVVIVNNTNGRADIIGYSDTAGAYNAVVLRAQGSYDQLYLDTSGNVGIQCDPNSNLEVFDASGGAGTGVRINCNNGGSDVWDLYSTTAGRLYVKNPNYSGGVYIQHGATSWTGNSDENLKENITSLGTVGDKLKNYRTSYFNWKDDNRETPPRQIGFIAQDWETDFPEVVNKVEGEPLGMQYTETIPILLKYIQELEARIETLEG